MVAANEVSFSDSEMQALKYSAIFVSALSFICSSLVIWSYFRFQRLQKFAFKLVVMLAISDVGSGVGYFIGSPPNGALCTIQGIILHYFQLSSFLWTTVIAFVLERTVCQQQGQAIQQRRDYLHLYAWGVPLILVVLPFTTARMMPHGLAYSNTFEGWSDSHDGAWCWIADDDSSGIGTSWRLLTFYLPLWSAMAYNLWSYNKVITTLRITLKSQSSETQIQQQDNDHQMKLKIVKRLRWYPALLVLCWTFATINRVQNAVHSRGRPIFALYILHAMFSSAQGLCNSVVYGLNKGVQSAWREKYPATAANYDIGCKSTCECRILPRLQPSLCSQSRHYEKQTSTSEVRALQGEESFVVTV